MRALMVGMTAQLAVIVRGRGPFVLGASAPAARRKQWATLMQGWRGVGRLALLCALIAACAEDAVEDPDMACTEEARASVVVQVVTTVGAPLPGAMVTYQVDGGPVQAAACIDPLDRPAACLVFVAGFEVPGTFMIRAEQPGFQPATVSVIVEQDEAGCHVLTQQITIPLVPG